MDPQILEITERAAYDLKERQEAIRYGVCNLHPESTFSDYQSDRCAHIYPDKKNIIVIGDSMAADTYMLLSQTYDVSRVIFSQATASACPALIDLQGLYPACMELNRYRFAELMKLKWDAVVLSSIWTSNNFAQLAQTVKVLQDAGQRVLIIGPRPAFNVSVPLFVSLQKSVDFANSKIQSEMDLHDDLFQDMHSRMPTVEIVDMGAIQCEPRCEILSGNKLLYYDEYHYTKTGAKTFGQTFWKKFDLWGFLGK